MVRFTLLSFLLSCFLVTYPSNCLSSPIETPLCRPNESSALLSFKSSFLAIDAEPPSSDCLDKFGVFAKPNSTIPWDICGWSGVECDEVTGHVIGLHLECGGLRGIMQPNSSLFSLTHLQTLVLSNNDIYGSFSPNFGRFQGMTHLDLSFCTFTGQVPPELASLHKLHTLDLRHFIPGLRLETSSLKRIVANLTNLRNLYLGTVIMSGVSPGSFANLSVSLTSLDLSNSELRGVFPEYLFRLPKLELLYLDSNAELTGSLPKYNWTSPLRSLMLSYGGFTIDIPSLTRNLKYLNRLYVRHCKLIGKFPAMLQNLTQITYLDMSYNDFGGRIPWESLNLENLTELDFSGNNFVDKLPELCRNSIRKNLLCDPSRNDQLVGALPSNLRSLSLSSNSLHGTIPAWLYSLPSLEGLFLGNNHFTGQINEFQFNTLKALSLRSNKLHGPLPRSIFQQANLSWLDLSSNNLSGIVKIEHFSNLKNLRDLRLSYNNLSLVFTSNTNYTLPNLWSLYMSSCNISEFPNSLRSLENLVSLDLSKNQIKGSVPRWLQNVGKDSLLSLNISHNLLTHMGSIPWKTLFFIDLRSNRLHGHVPIPPHSTITFYASNNEFVGELSPLLFNLSWIEVLDLSNNNLSGNIRPGTGSCSNSLVALNLRMNKFDGVIPSAFTKGNSLTFLNLNGNQLEGPLPESLVNCESLEFLDVGNNKLNGTFPRWLESLPELQVLVLRSNRFHGVITDPKARFPFQKLRIIDISDNKFAGFLPTKYVAEFKAMMDAHTTKLEYMGQNETIDEPDYSITVAVKGISIVLVKIQIMFMTIDLSRNNFTGEIPELVGKLNSLKGLNLSHNMLTGPIPNSMGNLSNLEWLDLSSNELIGNIPWQLAENLTQLAFINLSVNQLEGPIPHGKQFDTFTNDSYRGNPGLCGFPLSELCGELTTEQEGDVQVLDNGMFDWKIVMFGYASGVIIGVFLGYMGFFSRRFDNWLAKIIRRAPQRHHKINARCRGRGRN